MSEPINDVSYWARRLREAKHQHEAIFRCPLDRWQRIETRHREILAATIKDTDSVFDAGCGWGRLLTLLPATWYGGYLGVDLSPDFIRLARAEHRPRQFAVGDLRNLDSRLCGYDWAILISMKHMVIRNLGQEEWDKMELALRRVAKRLLFLEYSEDDKGSIE